MINRTMQHLGEERSVIRELFEYGNMRKAVVGEENVFDFSIGNPSVPAPDFVQSEIRRLIDTVPPEKLHGYTSAPGAPEVRKAVSDYIESKFGVPMSEGLIYMTCGAAASLSIAITALCEEGDEFAVIAPFFPEYRVYAEGAGAKVVVVPSAEDFHLDFDALDRAIGGRTKAVILNSPNNPTGAVISAEELTRLGALLERKSLEKGESIFLLADEPYRELTYGAEVPFPMKYYHDTILCYSFSKSLSLAGERIGYIAVSPFCCHAEDLFAAVCGAGRTLGYVCAPALFQRVCAASLGRSSDVGEYRKNRDLLFKALTEMGYECVPPEGAFYLFVKALGGDAVAFSERAKKYELLLVPSDSFGVKGYVRISYCVARSVIERSLPAFKKLYEEYKGIKN